MLTDHNSGSDPLKPDGSDDSPATRSEQHEASASPRGKGSAAGRDAEFASLASEIDEVARSAAKRIDPGPRGFFIAVLVFVLIIAQLLPWVEDSAGWEVLLYGEDGAIPRLFAATSTGIGIGATTVTLLARRWWLSWVSAVGSCVSAVEGVLAIWSQQSAGAPGEAGLGPGIGMVIAVVAMFLLAGSWMRTAWSRID